MYGYDGSVLNPCPRDSGSDAALDAPADAASTEAADAGCVGPMAPGDLIIDELMIASQAGDGDHGEWLEVMSTRTARSTSVASTRRSPTVRA